MERTAARSVLAYNVGRFGLFVGCAVLGYVAGLRGLVMLAAALIVSGVLSWFLLARQRAAMAEALGGAVTRSRSKLAQRTADEDAYADALQPGQSGMQSSKPAQENVTRPDR